MQPEHMTMTELKARAAELTSILATRTCNITATELIAINDAIIQKQAELYIS